MSVSTLVLSALCGCLPSNGDLEAYSADWSPHVDNAAQQMTLPNMVAAPDSNAPGGSSAPAQGAASSGDMNAAANPSAPSATPSSSNSELPPTPVGTGAAAQDTNGSTTHEPAAGEPTSASPDPAPAEVATSQEPPSVALPAVQCADGVLDVAETSCYRAATVPATWQAARGECTTWGGSLVKVESAEEDQFIGQLVTEDLWLGASDTAVENVFVWTDGSPILFGNWGPSQPDRFPGPDCVQKRSTAGRQWFDQPCDNAWLYICEKPIQR